MCVTGKVNLCAPRGFPNLLRALRLSTPEATRYTNGPNKTPTLFPTMPFFYFFSSPTSTSKCAPWPTSSPTYTRECFVKIHCNVMTFICLSVTIVSAHQHCFLLTKTSSITVNCILGTFTSHRIAVSASFATTAIYTFIIYYIFCLQSIVHNHLLTLHSLTIFLSPSPSG